MIERLAIADVWTFTPKRFADSRGWFSETFNERTLEEALAGRRFVQDNQSYSKQAGTLRGIHYQTAPMAQDKLVRCVKGSVFDVAVDLRRDSPTFGKWVSAILSAENGVQIFVPIGFGHAFLTLEPDCEVAYKVTNFYSKDNERGVIWDDASIAVTWPWSGAPHLSDKDAVLPALADQADLF